MLDLASCVPRNEPYACSVPAVAAMKRSGSKSWCVRTRSAPSRPMASRSAGTAGRMRTAGGAAWRASSISARTIPPPMRTSPILDAAPLAVDHGHRDRIVAGPGDLLRRERVVEDSHPVRAERNGSGGDVLLQVLDALGTGDRYGVLPLVEEPGDRDLARLDAERPRHLPHRLRGPHVGVEILPLVTGVAAAEIAFGILLRPLDLAGQEAAAERRERHQADAELADGRQDVPLQVPLPQRILALQRGDRVDGVGAPDVGDARLGEAEEAHLARGHQLAHRARHLLHRHRRVDAVLVEQVDAVRPEPPQGALDHLADVLRPAVAAGARLLPVLDAEAELRGEGHLVAPPLERPAQQLLVGVGAVDLRRVEEGASELDGAVEGGDGFALVAFLRGAVRRAHAHAAETDLRDLEALPAKLSFPKTHTSPPLATSSRVLSIIVRRNPREPGDKDDDIPARPTRVRFKPRHSAGSGPADRGRLLCRERSRSRRGVPADSRKRGRAPAGPAVLRPTALSIGLAFVRLRLGAGSERWRIWRPRAAQTTIRRQDPCDSSR